jgi:hypothetical protein
MQCVKCQQQRVFAKRIHTQMCLDVLFGQRRTIENKWKNVQNVQNVQNEWKDDEDEQRRAFHEEEEEKKNFQNYKKEQELKCEITGKTKHPDYSIDCDCKGICMTRVSEIYTIHYEGGVGIVKK